MTKKLFNYIRIKKLIVRSTNLFAILANYTASGLGRWAVLKEFFLRLRLQSFTYRGYILTVCGGPRVVQQDSSRGLSRAFAVGVLASVVSAAWVVSNYFFFTRTRVAGARSPRVPDRQLAHQSFLQVDQLCSEMPQSGGGFFPRIAVACQEEQFQLNLGQSQQAARRVIEVRREFGSKRALARQAYNDVCINGGFFLDRSVELGLAGEAQRMAVQQSFFKTVGLRPAEQRLRISESKDNVLQLKTAVGPFLKARVNLATRLVDLKPVLRDQETVILTQQRRLLTAGRIVGTEVHNLAAFLRPTGIMLFSSHGSGPRWLGLRLGLVGVVGVVWIYRR